MLFVGAAAVLEPEYATVGAALMPATPKNSPVATNYFLRSGNYVTFYPFNKSFRTNPDP